MDLVLKTRPVCSCSF